MGLVPYVDVSCSVPTKAITAVISNMKLFITLAIASLGVIGVVSQGGGGSAGGLLGGGGGGEGGGGDEGGGHEEHHHRGEGGFGGSHFITPVDVHHEEAIHLKAHPEYHYEYHVADHKTKDYKSKHEVRDGYKVKGTYSLLEPDHKTIRVVDYVSDKKTGFIAKVSHRKHN